MRILVVGGGGREHALVWKLAQSPRVKKIYAAPGNAGIAELAPCEPVGSEDIPGLVSLARQKGIDLVVVGPEAPLVDGLVDALAAGGIAAFGPARQAAVLEGSKVWAKEFMARHHIPTADFRVFEEIEPARDYIRSLGGRCVVKADGLAAGKGVVVSNDMEAALAALERLLVRQELGTAGRQVVVEERLEGEELSVLAFTDGQKLIPCPGVRDHKRAFDADRGPNTGGMGAYSPLPFYTPEMEVRVIKEVLQPTVEGMAAEGRPYRGVLYAGLMLTPDGPRVLEFNCRFGDPETQVLLPRLKTDLLDIMEAVVQGDLGRIAREIAWNPWAAACIVLASEGYPGDYIKGREISGLEDLPAGTLAFHAGTARKDGRLVTAGGRVAAITALGNTLEEAVARAYAGVERVSFAGMHYRRDIGFRGTVT